MTEEARQAGYDPDHPKLDEKFMAWMNHERFNKVHTAVSYSAKTDR